MLRAGIAETFSLTPRELAVICSSHAGERAHRELVRGLLKRGGLSESHLHCGIHPPFSRSERLRIIAAGELPDVTCSNCSGKHSGMLLSCVARGFPVEGYLDPDHPLQRSIRATLELFSGEILDETRLGIGRMRRPDLLHAHRFHRTLIQEPPGPAVPPTMWTGAESFSRYMTRSIPIRKLSVERADCPFAGVASSVAVGEPRRVPRE